MGYPQSSESATPLATAISLLGWTNARMAQELGTSPSAVNGWLAKGKCPKAVILAIDAILSAQSTPHLPTASTFLLLDIRSDGVVDPIWRGRPEEMTFGGEVYLLIPKPPATS